MRARFCTVVSCSIFPCKGVVGLPVQAGVFYGDRELTGSDLSKANLLVREVAELGTGHAQHTNQAFDREEHDGDDQKAAQVFLPKARHVLEAGVAPGVTNGHGLTNLGCPADDALADGQGGLPDSRGIECAGGAENQAVDGLVIEVNGDLGYA